jgi:hypothetical protein
MTTRKTKDADGGQDREPRKPHQEQKDAVKIHEAYLQHRLGGGAPATPEAYRRALEQFEKLPGAIRSTPAAPSHDPKPGDDPKPEKPRDGGGSQ